MCIGIYNFNFKKKLRRQKAKETKEEKRISVEDLTGYDDIVCEFALCTFNLLIESLISPGCSYELNVVYVKEITAFVILQQHMKYTLSRTKVKENH